MAAVRGIGVAVMTSTSGSSSGTGRRVATLRLQRSALLDTETVLFVHDHDAERRETHVICQEGVGSDAPGRQNRRPDLT